MCQVETWAEADRGCYRLYFGLRMEMGNGMGLYDAVPVPMMQPKGAVKYRRDRFPELVHLFSDPENLDPEVPEPYNSYNRLAEEVLRHQDNDNLFQSFCALLNELALSKEFWLEELLGDVLEGLVHDKLRGKLCSNLNSQAREKLAAASG